jgi:peptide/nickel transport system substrate-binding protein
MPSTRSASRPRAVVASTALLLTVLLTACTAGGTGGPGRVSGAAAGGRDTLTVALQSDMNTFDPDNGFEVAGLGAIRAVYQGLVEYKPGETAIRGLLAQSWRISPDGLTYTFRLRPGVRFHDGSPMAAQQVKESFDRRATGNLAGSYFLANLAATEAPSPDVFVLRLTRPQPSLLDNLASAWGPKVIGPTALVENAGTDRSVSWLTENADGTGPYRLASFERGRQYLLSRNDDYWGPEPYFRQIVIKIVPDIGQQVLQLRSGDLDAVLHGYPYTQLPQLPEGLQVEEYDNLGLQMAFINPARRLTTPALRRAVLAGMNPNGWVRDAYGDYATVAQSLYPQAMLVPETPYAYPPASAAQGVAVPPIEIVYAAEEAAVQQRVADLVIAQLRSSGITATSRAVPGSEVPSYVQDPASAPDVLLAQNNPDSAHPESQASLFFATGGPLNIFGYSNPAADALFAQGGELTDLAERDRRYADGGRLVFDDGAFAPLADVKDVVVHRAGLTALSTRPAVPWNVDFGTVREG